MSAPLFFVLNANIVKGNLAVWFHLTQSIFTERFSFRYLESAIVEIECSQVFEASYQTLGPRFMYIAKFQMNVFHLATYTPIPVDTGQIHSL